MPISGFKGDNITTKRQHAVVHRADADRASGNGRSSTSPRRQSKPFRMPVQWVNRPNLDFRGFSGPDRDRLGQAGRCDPRAAIGQDLTVTRIVTLDGDLDEAVAGQSVTVCFADEVDCSRGDVIATADPPQAADQFEATIVWMDDEPLHARAAPIG
jgi:bifunctional enzyme CysN/CysC